MPNSQRIEDYPILLLDAFRQCETHDPVVLEASTPAQARNLRSYCYTLRSLLRKSDVDWHNDLYHLVAKKKFYVDSHQLIIASTMYSLRAHTKPGAQP